MIRYNNLNIGDIKLGDLILNKIYKGNLLIFLKNTSVVEPDPPVIEEPEPDDSICFIIGTAESKPTKLYVNNVEVTPWYSTTTKKFKVVVTEPVTRIIFYNDPTDTTPVSNNSTIKTITKIKTISNITDMSYMFNNCDKLTSLPSNMNNWDVSNVTNMAYMFNNIRVSNINDIICNWNVSNVTNMSYMLAGTTRVTLYDLNTWNVSKVKNMSGMFDGTSADNINVNDWDVSNVTNMASMFSVTNFKSITLNKWDTRNVTDMADMFSYNEELLSLDLTTFNMSNVTTIAWMFCNCTNLRLLFVYNWDTTKINNMDSVFKSCPNLNVLILTTWNGSNNISWMFNDCAELYHIDIPNFNAPTSTVASIIDTFKNSPKISSIKCKLEFKDYCETNRIKMGIDIANINWEIV